MDPGWQVMTSGSRKQRKTNKQARGDGGGGHPFDDKSSVIFTTSTERFFHSPARRTIVIKVPRENDEYKSWYAVSGQSHVWNERRRTVLSMLQLRMRFALSVPFRAQASGLCGVGHENTIRGV